MDIIKRIADIANRHPNRVAYELEGKTMTYRELNLYSDRLAVYLLNQSGDKEPLMVYGHKSPLMLVSFLACVKSGRAYCPVDISVPARRVEMIARLLPSKFVLTPEPGAELPVTTDASLSGKEILHDKEILSDKQIPSGKKVLSASMLTEIIETETDPYDETNAAHGDDLFYIIFTSGSTGIPKGVQITCDNLNCFLDWSVTLGGNQVNMEGRIFLNQAPFSFDLSVMDLYTCLACGGTLKPITKAMQENYKALFARLLGAGANIWVSTPSFADVCLADPSFCADRMPDLRLFFLCGERLTNKTADRLLLRFPDAKILNTYGPTESTVAVTQVAITPALSRRENPLPVGYAKAGTKLRIVDENGQVLPDGEKGEILILGDTVSAGYFGNQAQTEQSFFTETRGGKHIRGYHTGDEGYLQGGMLYYCGRRDRQIKLHGYRIEMDDIENNLMRLDAIESAAVLPKRKDGTITSLVAFVKEKTGEVPDTRAESIRCKNELMHYLPQYMIPKKLLFLDEMPMTGNGKIDRRHLEGLLR